LRGQPDTPTYGQMPLYYITLHYIEINTCNN